MASVGVDFHEDGALMCLFPVVTFKGKEAPWSGWLISVLSVFVTFLFREPAVLSLF